MKRGISPVITSALLVLIAVAIVSIVYPWASGLANNISMLLSLDTDVYSTKIISNVDVFLPPAEISDTNTLVIIHNSGLRTLKPLTVYLIKRDQTVVSAIDITVVDVNGSTRVYNSGTADYLGPGETAIVRIPSTPDTYYGYTLVVTSGSYMKKVEWV